MTEPRAKTAEEVRDQFMRHIARTAKYWADLPDKTPLEKCNGLVFSILNIFDGNTLALPAIALVLDPHPDEKESFRSEGKNWYEFGQVITDGGLHDVWGSYEIKS